MANLWSPSIWDLFRSQLPFLTITDPLAVTEMIRSLIDTYRHVGWLPDCRMSLNKGYTQVISLVSLFSAASNISTNTIREGRMPILCSPMDISKVSGMASM